jgi:hypothetical protein
VPKTAEPDGCQHRLDVCRCRPDRTHGREVGWWLWELTEKLLRLIGMGRPYVDTQIRWAPARGGRQAALKGCGRVLRAVVAVASVLVIPACASAGMAGTAPGDALDPRIAVSTWRGEDGLRALGAGRLWMSEGSCVFLGGTSGQRMIPIWPRGYTADLSESGTVEILDWRGRLVAREGDYLQLAGGFMTPSAVRELAGCRFHSVFAVHEQLPPLNARSVG